MQTIRIFLASSCELAEERKYLGDCIRKFSDEWTDENVRISLQIWEDYHPEYRGVRLQTEYDENLVKTADVVIGLFRDFCGMYTQEEIRIAKTCNPDNLHIFLLPPKVSNDKVIEFLGSEGLVPVQCADIDAVWVNVSVRLCNYIVNNIKTEDRSYASPVRSSNLYATLFPGMEHIGVELGEIVRSLSEVLYNQQIVDLHLHPFSNQPLIADSEHYIAFMKDVTNANAEAEFSYAFALNAANKSPHISPYITEGGNISQRSNVMDNLLKTTGAFPVDLKNLDFVKLNLLLYYYRQLNFLTVDFANSPFRYSGGDLYFGNRLIVRAESLSCNAKLKDKLAEYDDVCTKLIALSDNANLENTKILLNKRREGLLNNIMMMLSNLLTELMRKGAKANLSIDVTKPYDADVASHVFWENEECIENATKVIQDAINEQLQVLNDMQRRIDYLFSNVKTKEEAQELIGLVISRKRLVEKYRHRLAGNEVMMLEAKIDEVRVCDAFDLSELDGRTEDDIFGEVYSLADEYGLRSSNSEMARFNYANMLARTGALRDAIGLYAICVDNLSDLYKQTHQHASFLSRAYAHTIHAAYELGDDEIVVRYCNKYGDFVGHVAKADEMENILLQADYYLAILRIVPLSQVINMYPILNAAISLYDNLDQSYRLPITDDNYGLLYCYLPNVISTFFIDRYEDAPNRSQYEQKGLSYTDTTYTNASRLRLFNPEEGLRFMAMACHNRGYLHSKLKQFDNAITYLEEALMIREDQHRRLNNRDSLIELLETLVNLASAKLDWCKEHNRRTNHNPEPIARRAYYLAVEKLKKVTDEGPLTHYYKCVQVYASVLYEFGSKAKKQRALEMLKTCWEWNVTHPSNNYFPQFCGTAGRILAAEGFIETLNIE